MLHGCLTTVLAADDTIARTATEDEEAAAEVHAVRLTCPALTMVRSSGRNITALYSCFDLISSSLPRSFSAPIHPDPVERGIKFHSCYLAADVSRAQSRPVVLHVVPSHD